MTAASRRSRPRPSVPARAASRVAGRAGRRIRILLADDHHVVRQGLASLIATEPDLEVAGEACDGEEACRRYLALRPDVLVLDLRMPLLDGTQVVERVMAADPGARILVMTTYDTDEDVWRSIRSGARGYLLKDASHAEIVNAIRTVAAGGSVVPPRIATALARRARQPDLSRREADVLGLLAAGLTDKEIAVRLGIGEGTVKTHVKAVLAKLGASTRTEAARRARERGLV